MLRLPPRVESPTGEEIAQHLDPNFTDDLLLNLVESIDTRKVYSLIARYLAETYPDGYTNVPDSQLLSGILEIFTLLNRDSQKVPKVLARIRANSPTR